MNYYFDESGDWQDIENRFLVLGGMVVPDSLQLKLEQEFKILTAEEKLTYFHAADMNKEAKGKLYSLINSLLKQGVKVLVRIYDKDITKKYSLQNSDDVYIEYASDLVNTISFGDKDINIFFDMKFHYAYPANVIEKISQKIPHVYYKMKSMFELNEDYFVASRKNIASRVENTLKNRKYLPEYKKKKLRDFIWKISDKQVSVNILDNFTSQHFLFRRRQDIKRLVTDYLWTEFCLKTEVSQKMRESFRTAIIQKFRNLNNTLESDLSEPNIQLDFVFKEENNPGLAMIDTICNLIYHNAGKSSENDSAVIKNLCANIEIEDFRE